MPFVFQSASGALAGSGTLVEIEKTSGILVTVTSTNPSYVDIVTMSFLVKGMETVIVVFMDENRNTIEEQTVSAF